MAFSSEMTTGMSAPPIRKTTNRPITPARISSSTIHHHALPSPGWACSPMYTAAPIAPSSRTMLAAWKNFAPATSLFLDVLRIDSCNLANATSEPQNDTEPMIAANRIRRPVPPSATGRHRSARSLRLNEFRPRDQRYRAASHAVEQRDQLRHRRHLGLLGRRHAEDHPAPDPPRSGSS